MEDVCVFLEDSVGTGNGASDKAPQPGSSFWPDYQDSPPTPRSAGSSPVSCPPSPNLPDGAVLDAVDENGKFNASITAAKSTDNTLDVQANNRKRRFEQTKKSLSHDAKQKKKMTEEELMESAGQSEKSLDAFLCPCGLQSKDEKLSILQWNCQAISTKVYFLINYLQNQLRVDVLMLQSLDTRRDPPVLEGFYYPPVVGKEVDRIMVATYVNRRLTYTEPQLPTGEVECRIITCTVSIHRKGDRQINLVNVYYPDGSTNEEQVAWLKRLDTEKSSWVVAGDFNVSHRLWDAGQTKNTGVHLATTIRDSDLTLLNDGRITRLGYKNQRSSAIDLSLVTPDLCLDAKWESGNDSLQSDHLPLHIVLGHQEPVLADHDQSPKFHLEKANWVLFELELEVESEMNDPVDQSIDVYYENIREMVLRAADTAIPKKAPWARGKHSSTPEWWNEECDRATAARKHALNNFQENKSERMKATLKEATHHCRRVADTACREHWERFCMEEVREPEDGSEMWSKIQKFWRCARPSERPLLVNGQLTQNAKEKADALAQTFSRVSQTDHLPAEMMQYRLEDKGNFTLPASDVDSAPFNSDLTIGELRTAIRSLKTASIATGMDPISYHMIHRFPDIMVEVLLNFYQRCWKSGTIPKAWKETLVVAIPKDGKPSELPTSYRPMGLTPHLGNVYERIVQNRLEYHLERHDILPLCQAGFRKGSDCVEHVVRLLEDVKKGQRQRFPKTTVATFFKIKNAVDTLWHARLLKKLLSLGITGRLYQFIEAFLDSRQMAVKVGSATSKMHRLHMGLPQSSVIAPILFSVMLHDIFMEIDEDLKISLYVDNLTIWTDHRHVGKSKSMEKFQRGIDTIQARLQRNGFQLNAEKTVFMVFAKKQQQRDEYSIRIGGHHVIQPSKQVKFLAVTITQDLKWGVHIRQLVNEAMPAVETIKSLTRKTWATPNSLIHLTKVLVRSRLIYGHEAFFSAPQYLWSKLKSVELAALKHAMGLHPCAVNDLVYQEAGWLPLEDECRLRCASFEARASTAPRNVMAALSTYPKPDEMAVCRYMAEKKPMLYERIRSLRSQTTEIWEKSKITPKQVEPMPSMAYAPWEMKRPQIVADRSPVASPANAQLEERYSAHLDIYIDGFLLENGDAGSALEIPNLGIFRRYRLKEGVCVFTAKLHAILMACTMVKDMPQPPPEVIILSDSRFLLRL